MADRVAILLRMCAPGDDADGAARTAPDLRDIERSTPSAELAAAIIGASLDAILTLTREGVIVDLNRAAERLYQVSRGAVGEHFTSFVPPRDRQVWEDLQAVMKELGLPASGKAKD